MIVQITVRDCIVQMAEFKARFRWHDVKWLWLTLYWMDHITWYPVDRSIQYIVFIVALTC